MGQDLIDKLASGQKVDFGYMYIRLESGSRIGDWVYATFSEFIPANAGLAQYGVSSGYCVAIDCSNGCAMNGTPNDMSPAQLGAGALTLDSTIQIPGYRGAYGGILNPNGGRYLWAGRPYMISATGGSPVGSFSATESFAIPGNEQFTSPTEGQPVSLKSDFTVKWDSAQFVKQDGLVSINGVSFTNGYKLYAYLQCTAPVAPGQFTIPAWVLSVLPPSGATANGSALGYMWIGQYDAPTSFSATGLDKGLFTDITHFLRTVNFQ